MVPPRIEFPFQLPPAGKVLEGPSLPSTGHLLADRDVATATREEICDEKDGRSFYGIAFGLILEGRDYPLVALRVSKIVVELGSDVIDLLFCADRS